MLPEMHSTTYIFLTFFFNISKDVLESLKVDILGPSLAGWLFNMTQIEGGNPAVLP